MLHLRSIGLMASGTSAHPGLVSILIRPPNADLQTRTEQRRLLHDNNVIPECDTNPSPSMNHRLFQSGSPFMGICMSNHWLNQQFVLQVD